MGQLADQLEDAVTSLRQWDIRVVDAGRLRHAVRVLRGVPAVEAFPPDRTRLREIAFAARDAQEFAEIADVLPTEERLRPLAESLQRSVSGVLGSARDRAAQYQSELWVGAMLAHSGARTAVITSGTGKRPDFVILDGTMLYPVEVKRPAGKLDAAELVSEAARQLLGPRYHGGAIVVDFTDCIDEALSCRFGDGPPDRRPVHAEVIRLSQAVHAEIFDGDSERIRRGREHVFALVSFARSIYWDERDLSQMYLLRMVASVSFYRGHANNLRGHRAWALANAIHAGIRAVGHQWLDQLDIVYPSNGKYGV
jgi:hypothetical protein